MISDHGASRLAVIKEHTLDINVNSKGTHSGRVCALTDDISEVSCATKSGDYYVLANYDRFKGGRAANVEVHGGATLEELTVPVIALTIAPESIEITILTPEITISFRKKAEIRLYSNTRLNDVSILVSGNFYKQNMMVQRTLSKCRTSESKTIHSRCVFRKHSRKNGTFLHCKEGRRKRKGIILTGGDQHG